MSLKQINDYFSQFIAEHGDEELLEKWNENQDTLKKLLSGKRTKKIKKLDNGVKRNINGYMFFCIAERPLVVRDMPDLSNKDILKEIGGRWQKMKKGNTTRYKQFMQQALEDKERYDKEKSNSVEEEIEAETKPKKSKKVVKQVVEHKEVKIAIEKPKRGRKKTVPVEDYDDE